MQRLVLRCSGAVIVVVVIAVFAIWGRVVVCILGKIIAVEGFSLEAPAAVVDHAGVDEGG